MKDTLKGVLFSVVIMGLLGLTLGVIWTIVAPHPISELTQGVVVDEAITTGSHGGTYRKKIVDIGQEDYVAATVTLTEYSRIEIGDTVTLCAMTTWYSKHRFYSVCSGE